MTAIIVGVNRAYASGVSPLAIGRQGAITDGFAVASLTGYINHLLARRMHVLAQGGNAAVSAGLPSSGQNGVVRFHTSPNCKRVYMSAICARSGSNTVLGSFNWNVFSSTGTGLGGLDTIYVGGASGSAASPNDLSIHTQRVAIANVDLSPDTTYGMRLTGASTNVQLLYFVVYELPRSTVDTTTDTAIPLHPFQVGAPILDRDIGDLTDSLWTMYKRGGPMQGVYSDITATPVTSVGTTWTNIMDGSTTGFAAGAAGLRTIPYRKNRATGTTLDVVFWSNTQALGAAATAEIRFVNSSGTIASMTGLDGSLGATGMVLHTTSGTLDATLATSDLVIAEQRNATAGQGVTTTAFGIYEFLT